MAGLPPTSMQYSVLGRSGLVVSRLSLGSWVTFKSQVDIDLAYSIMKAAYGHGVNFFDNAEGYAAGDSEHIMGAAVKQGIDKGDWLRSDLVLSTKIYFGVKPGHNARGLSRKHIVEGMQASLKRLDMDYVDIVFCHRPDPVTPIEETVRAMNHIIERGWAFYWGTSEWSAQQITEACRIADKLNLMQPIAEQPEYNLFARQKVEIDYAPLYKAFGMGTTIWSPLASGILTGKYSGKKIPEGSRLALADYAWLQKSKFGPDNVWQLEAADALAPIAQQIGCTLGQLAIAWCLRNEHVSTVITGATSVEQVHENMKAVEFVERITDDIAEEIEEIVKTKPTPSRVELQVAALRNTAALHGLK
eukprot:jgi/Chlat1/43/ChrspC236673S00923